MSYLAEILEQKLIPWSGQETASRMIVARPVMKPADLPAGVQLVRSKISSERVVMKNQRLYNNKRSITALWPQAGLNEFSYFKLACVISGHIDYQVGNYRLQCGSGHFIFLPPGTPHPNGAESYADKRHGEECEMLFFALHQVALECWVSHWAGGHRWQEGKFLLLHEPTAALLRTLADEMSAGEEFADAICEDLLGAFLRLLLRHEKAGRLQSIRTNAPHWLEETQYADLTPADFAARLENYVQTNLHKPLTLETVARDMFLSRTQFIRTMRSETGQSFNEFLALHRVAEAKKMLQDTPWTVTAISFSVGFKSSSYFRTFFRERTGETPTEFRARAKGGGTV